MTRSDAEPGDVDGFPDLRQIVHALDEIEALQYDTQSRGDPSSRGDILLPARMIPVPKSISPEAQALLAAAVAHSRAEPLPPHESAPEVWRRLIGQFDSMILSMLAGWEGARDLDTRVEVASAVRVYVTVPPSAVDDACYLDLHGGGLISGGGEACRLMGCLTAATVGLRTCSPDYRMPPDHPHPAALDDCVAVYRMLVERYGADRVIVGGASAGGNLAAALVLRARDEGLPMPAGLVLCTPELDLTESGDTFASLRNVDAVLPLPLMEANLLYAAGADLSSPLLSPLFGDFSKGFPRTFLQSGTRDLFLSNTVRMHRALRRAGVEVELHVFEAMPHGGFGGAPEDAELSGEIRRFVADCLRPA
ncbi:MAG: hypothetical protein NAOJABEB_00038 [Steroidobacteraceae bacterium]|nr:hypothetical protein [Steroidobacteraceae bacterium]